MYNRRLEDKGMRSEMEFVLNEYHRNISDEELLQDVKQTAKKMKKDDLTKKEYTENGRYHSSTLEKRFGSWKKVLELAGLNCKNHNYSYEMTSEEAIQDIKYVAELLGKNTVTAKEYNKYGKFHSSTLCHHIGPWNSILELAGMKVGVNR